MKRFWTTAEAAEDLGVWQVRLDGRPVRLPSGTPLALTRPALAAAVAAEWQAAGGAPGGEMGWNDVPLTRLAGTVQERIAPDTEAVVLELARYGESDLLCYRADRPEALARRQALLWQPWLDWAEARTGARLRVTTGVIHVAQDPAALAALAQAVAAHDAGGLAGLGVAVPALGSLVLGLAMAVGDLSAAAAHELGSLDETFQAEQWGEDEEAAARRRNVAADLALAGRFFDLTRVETG
jgi:chaperone required for assembly of F1-ATPase